MTDDEGQREAARLRTLLDTGLLTAAPPPELDAICRAARERFDVPIAFVTLVDRDRLVVKGRAGSDAEELPRSLAFCDYTIRTDKVFVIPDMQADPRFADHPLVIAEPFMRFYAGAPLIYLREIRLGALCVLDVRPREFSPGDRAELAQLADEVVGIIARLEFGDLPRVSPR
ncbi:GAF domain-containing protein [Rubellimicrobium roseum]|uniref:GAF domain-containing protein n=1 Tax=Rubellimicrobium roseum TaxID=687525 RepID=A0A5C4N6K5_9RHOB|nr:GAF domain-containing protein [Rubellimicrobium roseum]TNC66579.1 GAF domain-containing protein [Rubellimicrobium roseum]